MVFLLWILIYILIALLLWYIIIWVFDLIGFPIPLNIRKIIGALFVLIVIIGVLTGGFPPLFHLGR